ncbi:MAG: hypothetical protein FJ025_01505 [Chloroflexi bacterium]|nr:hypothetical protein [Chloroflexota bacterium]
MKTGVIDQLLKGAIDFHVHADPDPVFDRRLDALDLAVQAKEAGMKAVVFKCHHYGTAPLVNTVNRVVPDFRLLGSLTLNKGAGGLSPEVVEVAVKLGAKVIWMPTYSSVVDTERRGASPEEGLSLIDRHGKLVPAIEPILKIIKDNDLVLGTGHVSVPEIYALTNEARRRQIKLTITHPLTKGFGSTLTVGQQQELVNKGAYIEHCFVACTPAFGNLDPAVIVEHIKAVGAEHCILSTDFGQAVNPAPIDGFRTMLDRMLKSGLSEKELEILVKVNPARLLDLG